MPRPLPSYEDTPLPGSVSLARKLRVAGAQLKTKRPALGLQDFSDLLSRALSEYLEKYYPGLIAEVERELREAARKLAPGELMVAEDRELDGQALAAKHEEDRARKNRSKRAEETAKGKAGPGKKS